MSDVAKQEKAYEMLKQAVTNIYKEIEEDKSLDRVNLQNLLNDHPDLTPDDYAEVSKNTLKFAYAQADREVPKEFIERIDRALNL
ncbi:MAG: hypothetical protein HWD61_13045 [Parachlamydiaceae bacterium]|nr:MAG: hypothetical protein HWD61_13045 [Parachlamydiaceae bacterium]